MPREFLGGFELLVLLALLHIGDEAYGVPISQAIEESSGREVALGSVYVALDRLEQKGFVSSKLGEPPQFAAGEPKPIFASRPRDCGKSVRRSAHWWRYGGVSRNFKGEQHDGHISAARGDLVIGALR